MTGKTFRLKNTSSSTGLDKIYNIEVRRNKKGGEKNGKKSYLVPPCAPSLGTVVSVRQPCSRVLSSNRHSILLPIEINMHLNRVPGLSLPFLFFRYTWRARWGLRHSDYVESFVTIEKWVSESGGWSHGESERLERVFERGFLKGKKWCTYFRLFLRVHHRKIIYEGDHKRVIAASSSILRTHFPFRRIRILLFFLFPSGMKKRVRVGESTRVKQ